MANYFISEYCILPPDFYREVPYFHHKILKLSLNINCLMIIAGVQNSNFFYLFLSPYSPQTSVLEYSHHLNLHKICLL